MNAKATQRPQMISDDSFRARMEAQCCRIEQYRQKVMREEQRLLSQDEAAMEWIERYAELFPGGEGTS